MYGRFILCLFVFGFWFLFFVLPPPPPPPPLSVLSPLPPSPLPPPLISNTFSLPFSLNYGPYFFRFVVFWKSLTTLIENQIVWKRLPPIVLSFWLFLSALNKILLDNSKKKKKSCSSLFSFSPLSTSRSYSPIIFSSSPLAFFAFCFFFFGLMTLPFSEMLSCGREGVSLWVLSWLHGVETKMNG